jgi:hypothetical protein
MSVPRRHFRFFFSFESYLNEFRSYINDFIDEFSLRVHLFRILRYKRQGFLDFFEKLSIVACVCTFVVVYLVVAVNFVFRSFRIQNFSAGFALFFLVLFFYKNDVEVGDVVLCEDIVSTDGVVVQKSASQPEISSGGVS